MAKKKSTFGADFKKFIDTFSDVSDKGITIRVKIGNRRQLVQMIGISADGILKYKPFNGKNTETSLKDQRGAAVAAQLLEITNFKHIDFYVLLLSGCSRKELISKAPFQEWKWLLEKVAL